MSDITVDYTAAQPTAAPRSVPNFGIVVVIALALASAALGLTNPAAIDAEYQTADAVLIGL